MAVLFCLYGSIQFLQFTSIFKNFEDLIRLRDGLVAPCHTIDFLVQDFLLMLTLSGFTYAAKVITDVIKSEMQKEATDEDNPTAM